LRISVKASKPYQVVQREIDMPRIEVIKESCKGCQLCVPACPHGLVLFTKTEINQMGYYPVEYVDPEDKCTGCMLCAIICPDVAIRVYK